MLSLFTMESRCSCWCLEKLRDSRTHSAHRTAEGTHKPNSAAEPHADERYRKHLGGAGCSMFCGALLFPELPREVSHPHHMNEDTGLAT